MSIKIECFKGAEIKPIITELAQLRIEVFREYPYLYDGDLDYEAKYLAHYCEHPSSICVVTWHEGRIVGASTGMWLNHAAAEFKACFLAQNLTTDKLFYFGESVLLEAYRGQGIGHCFFDERERHAQQMGAKAVVFCAVDRPLNDPKRPLHFRDLTPFWQRRHYLKNPQLVTHFSWREIDTQNPIDHTMTFWMKPLS